MDGYRELFHAFNQVYASTQPQRDVNQDLIYIKMLVRDKYILTYVQLELELDPNVAPLRLEGGMQSIFLELMHNAAQYGAGRLLVKTTYDLDERRVRVCFYNDGEPIPEDQWESVLDHHVRSEGRGFGLADARYIVEALNSGTLRLAPSDRDPFSVLFVIDLPVED
jgi:K+-sensing histidine kinase KdpD